MVIGQSVIGQLVDQLQITNLLIHRPGRFHMNRDMIELRQSGAKFALDVFGQQMCFDERRATRSVTVQGHIDALRGVTVPQNNVVARARAAYVIGNGDNLIAQAVGLRAAERQRKIAGQRRLDVRHDVGYFGQFTARAQFEFADQRVRLG